MAMQQKTQMQVRIDTRTKKEAKKILEEIGMDASTAVNILFKQIVRTKTFPVKLWDINGFRPYKAQELREAIADVKRSSKSFKTTKALMTDLCS